MYEQNLTQKQLLTSIHSQEDYDKFFQEARGTITCPKCENKHGLVIKEQYPRWQFAGKDPSLRKQIYVVRLKCPCKKTFTFLPPEILPNKRYSKTIIFWIVNQIQNQSETSYAIEKILDIPKSLIDSWCLEFKDACPKN